MLEAWAQANYDPPAGNHPFFLRRAHESGCTYVGDICDESGRILSFPEIVKKFGECMTWLHYNQLCSALPGWWKEVLMLSTTELLVDRLSRVDRIPSTGMC